MGSKIDVSQMSREQKQAMLKELIAGKKLKESYYQLSSGQKGLWFLQRMKPESYAYNVPCAFRIHGRVDIDALKNAFTCLTDRRPVLRTVLKTDESGQPLQSVSYKQPLYFKKKSISHIEESGIEPFLRAVAHEPFDLEKGPLFRVYLFSRSDTEHILLVNLHHIIFDGSSSLFFIDELIRIYIAGLSGKEAALPEISSSFADYVKWQQNMLSGDEGETHKTYWLEKLEGELPVLNLPGDFRSEGKSLYGGCETVKMKISAELSADLKRVASDNRVYLFTVLLCAFKVLMYRYTDQDDIITGIPSAGRTRTEFENLIGYFINMLPVRVRIPEAITFTDLLKQVHEACMGALRHQDYPFPEIVRSLREKGWSDTHEKPLFQTSFVLQNWAKGFEKNFVEVRDEKGQGFRMEPMLNIQQEEDFNLALEVLDLDEFQFFFKYDAGLYRHDTITRMAEHFRKLLEGIAENPAQKISQLPLLTESERHRILVEWNDTERDFPDGISLHQLIEEQVKKRPEAAALHHGTDEATEELTYEALNGRANQVGRYLKRLGLTTGMRVALCMERSIDMVIGLLGIMKAGGVYVPIDPEYPEKRIRYMLEDMNASFILTQEKMLSGRLLSGELSGNGAGVISLEAEWPSIEQEDSSNIPCITSPEDLAYIIYTSGSTGLPKGVMIRHRGVLNLAQAQIRLFGVEPDSRVLQFASISFDASISEIAMTLCSGALLCLASKADLMPGEKLEETLIRDAITHITLPPTALSVMTPDNLRDISTIVVAGEACPPELASIWSKDRIFINAYGPTESTVCASGIRYDGRKESLPDGPLPIGRPIDNTQLFILDRSLQPVPVGVPGELHIGGVGLAPGYLNRPELTLEKFIENPFDHIAHSAHSDHKNNQGNGKKKRGRLYRSGDLCRFLPDGNIEFLGRMDHQIKIRGFRIEPGEIEAVLREHEKVKEAVVAPGGDGKQLIAWVTPEKPDELPGQLELRAFLKTKLPDFMIPAPIVTLPEMPLTPNGKVDRKALPIPDPEFIREQPFAAPETETQKMLASIWKEVLKVETFSIHDDFFMMGGHSLMATVVVSRIQKALNAKVPISAMFDFPTIAALSDHLEEFLKREPESYSTILPVDRKRPLELSFGQQRLWFLDKFEGGSSSSYNVPVAFRVSGRIDISAFNRSINEIIRRHEVLRTIFKDPIDNFIEDNRNLDTGGMDQNNLDQNNKESETTWSPEGKDADSFLGSAPLQVILPELKLSLTLMDISRVAENEREGKAGEIISDESRKPFDLSRGPLIRALLIRMDPEEHLFLMTLHHIVFDGWSVDLFFREFEQLYGAYTLGRPSPLPDPDIQYADFAHWQREILKGKKLDAHLSYWKKQLAGVPLSTELPTDRPRPPVQTYNGDFIRFQLEQALAGRLNRLCHTSGVTLFMTLYAAFAVLLSKYGAKEDIVIGSPVANRNHAQTESLIGFFVNTLALRADLSGDPQFTALLQRVKKSTIEAYEHQDLPFERLVTAEELNIERSMSHSPLFQVMFDLHNSGGGENFETGGLTFSPVEVDFKVVKFDLSLSMVAGREEISGVFQYNTDLFDRTTIERTVSHFVELLSDIAAHPQKALSELSILPGWERELLMVEFNKTEADFPDNTLAHRLFEAQVEKTPEAIAVVFQDETLTYRELNERANRTGHYLQKLGVGPDVLVGLYMERSFDMITGLLGILKAGGAYVPLDPSYPMDRILYILEDADAPVLLTQSTLLASLPETRALPVCMDRDWEKIAAEDSGEVESNAEPHNMIWVIYTSGTTGRPKGVMIEHRSACARLQFWKETYNLGPEDVAIHYRPYSFDGSVEEYLLPLTVGARFIMAPGNIAVTDNIADYLINSIEKYRVTKINMPPVLLDVFLEELKRSGPEKVRSLHTVISGGDKLTRDIVRKFTALFDRAFLYNTYGPTENTVDSMNWRCDLTEGKGHVLLGKSVSNTRSYILDGNAKPVPIGVPGELVVSGVGLARGYLKRPDLTEKAFIPDPFISDSLRGSKGSRLYKTGDLCRCLVDGNIAFLGRIDHQVKIRGFRIELGEIESVLSRHEEVNEAVVIAREDRPGNKQLAAYVTSDVARKHPDEADLRAFMKTILPDYMIPAFIVFLKEFPLTSNGKIDRKALPAPAIAASDREYTAPRTQKEKILAQIWSETLGVPRIGINDNFFSLGGDSIISIRIISRAAEKGLSLAVKQMFEHPTIAEQALAATTKKKISAEQGIVTGELPLTPIMESFFEEPSIDPHHFNQYIVLRIPGSLDADLLRRALGVMISHHDTLRLNFTMENGAFRASCADFQPDAAGAILDVLDLSEISIDDLMPAMEKRAAEYQEGFDLGAGCLLKALLCLTKKKENYLWVIVHHLAVDGVSWRIFMEDFQRLCAMGSDGEKMELPPKTTSFREWAFRLKEYAGSRELINEKEYWLSKSYSLPMPVDHPYDPSVNTLEASKTVKVTLSEKESHLLRYKAPEVYGVRTNQLLLSALAMALCRWSGAEKSLIGLEGHGREELFKEADLSRTMGWFTSLYPVVLTVGDRETVDPESVDQKTENQKIDQKIRDREAGNPKAGDQRAWNLPELKAIVTSIRAQMDAIPDNGIGYGILRHMTPDRKIRDQFRALPSPQVIFNYFGQLDESSPGSNFALERIGFSESTGRARKSLLDIGGGIMDGRLEILFSYCRKIHDEATVERLAGDFEATLRNLIEECRSSCLRERFVHREFPQFPELIYMNRGTEGSPVFWIHGGLGGVGAYLKLAGRIRRPFYGIQARGYMSDRAPIPGVREKAAYYMSIIRAVQPEGPYHLGGYSYGGTLAYEVTRQLQAIGESVASIVMLDSRADSESESGFSVFNRKEAMLQAVNIGLFESAFPKGDEEMAKVLIHRNELDVSMDDDAFLEALIEKSKARRLFKVKEKAAAQVRSIVRTIEKSHTEKYTAQPLIEPDSVTCHYFRDRSGRLLGDLEPYFSLGSEEEKERTGYWDVWGKHIPDFRLIDVSSPNHMAMLTDPKAFEEIALVCDTLYSEKRIPEKVLN